MPNATDVSHRGDPLTTPATRPSRRTAEPAVPADHGAARHRVGHPGVDAARRRWAAEPPVSQPRRRRAGLTAPRLRKREAAAFSPWLIGVACLCIGVPVIAAALSGSLAIPHNDAWSMSRITATYATTGQIHLLDWNDMNLIGQVVMLGPFGSSVVVQQLAVAVLSLACLLCAYRLLAVSVTTRDALLGTLLLGVWPGWASLSTSFETDVPAFAATFAALLVGRRALMRDSRGWFAAALLTSLWAVTIREQAIVAPAAILLYGWTTRRSREHLGARTLIAATVGITGVLLAFEAWRWSLPLGQDPAPSAGALGFLGDLGADAVRTYLTLALCLAPAVLIGAGRHRWVRRDWRALAAGGVLVAAALSCGGLFGRYLEPSGEYFQVLAGVRVVIPPAAWDGLLDLAAVSGVLMAVVIGGRWRSVDPLLGLFTVLAFAEIVVIGASGNGVWDRYLPVLVPGTLTVLLGRATVGARSASSPDRGAGAVVFRVLAAATLVAITTISAMLAADGLAFDSARWHVAQRVARTGVPADRIDAGMEWVGWHSAHGMIDGRGQIGRPGGWQLAFSRTPACVVLSSSALGPGVTTWDAGWTPAGSVTYPTYLIGGRSRLYLYRTHAQGCTS